MTNHIRIPDILPVTQTVADGAKTVFSFPFPIFQASDLEIRANATLVTSGYTVLGEGSSTGGAVIFADAPASGVRVTLRRRQTYVRTDDFLDERAPTPHELNDAVDENVAAIQELAEQVGRAVTRPLSADLSQPLDLSLPAPEAGKVIGWNDTAGGLANIDQLSSADALLKSQNLADLPDKAAARGNLGLATVAASGSYADLADKPNLAAVALSGQYADLAGKPALGSAASLAVDTDGTLAANSDGVIASQKAVKTYVDNAASGVSSNALLKAQNLADLSNAATARTNLGLAAVAASGAYSDLSGKPALATVATSGAYGDLSGLPALGSAAYQNIGTSGATVPLLNAANTYGAPQTPASQVLTDAATVGIAITSQVWTLTTTAARTIGAPTGGVAGTFYFLEIVTNGFTPAWNSAFDFGAAGAPTALLGTCGFDIFYDGSKYRISTRFTGGV